jgi:TolA-binding protein
MEKYDDVVATADELLKNGGLTAEEENEVRLARARAYSKLHKGSLAEKDFAQLAKDTRNVYGAQSAYYLAQEQYDAGNLKDAEKTLNSFIDSGTPHQYWLARGFILLSDIYHKRGADFEACQYLESLKSNYPGKDSDIFSMIQERLGKWKGAAKDTKSNKKK